jgi:hypothetical protein
MVNAEREPIDTLRERLLVAASRPLVFDRIAGAPGARSLSNWDFLEQVDAAGIVGNIQAPRWLITTPDRVVQSNRNG